MLQFLSPTRFKLIVTLIVAISSFLSTEVVRSAERKIWHKVSPNLSKQYLMESVPEQGAFSLSSSWQRFEAVSEIKKSDIEKALWLEWFASLLVFTLIGYLSSCLIVAVGNHEK